MVTVFLLNVIRRNVRQGLTEDYLTSVVANRMVEIKVAACFSVQSICICEAVFGKVNDGVHNFAKDVVATSLLISELKKMFQNGLNIR